MIAAAWLCAFNYSSAAQRDVALKINERKRKELAGLPSAGQGAGSRAHLGPKGSVASRVCSWERALWACVMASPVNSPCTQAGQSPTPSAGQQPHLLGVLWGGGTSHPLAQGHKLTQLCHAGIDVERWLPPLKSPPKNTLLMGVQSSQAIVTLLWRWVLGCVACLKLGQPWPGGGGDYG